MRELASAIMGSSLPAGQAERFANVYPGITADDVSMSAVMISAQVTKARDGDTRAFHELMELSGAYAEPQGEPGGEGRPFCADFGVLAADPFMCLHRRCAEGAGIDAWIKGGRSSAKSSYVSLEVVNLLERHPEYSALVMVKLQKDARTGVYEQMLWALRELGVAEEWDCTVSPMRMVRRATGQQITFKGCDRASKTKGLKAPASTYYAVLWIEEADQFAGMAELRTVYQSATRGAPAGSPFYRFHTYNPPRARDSWANREAERRQAEGLPVVTSNYTDLPAGWLPEQVMEDAAALRAVDEDAYRHEWLGEPVGYGAEVFARAQVREVGAEEREGIERRYFGVDWGFSQDPWVWVEVGYDRATRTLYVLDELHGRGLDNTATAAMALERMGADEPGRGPVPGAPVVCDCAEPKSIADWRSCGVRAEKSPKGGPHDVRNSVRWLQGRAAIVIDPRCEVAAREFTGYCYELTPEGEPTGNLPDRDNHAIDAVRYACATLIADRSCV